MVFQCDAGTMNGAPYSGCSKDCTLCGYCGDGHIDAGEECDDGWRNNGQVWSKCTGQCKLVNHCKEYCHPTCGNGIKEAGEQCDFGKKNGIPGSRCSANCTWIQAKCGNGVTEWPEMCDDGDMNGTPDSRCTTSCTWKEDCGNPSPPVCGNGIVEGPQEEVSNIFIIVDLHSLTLMFTVRRRSGQRYP